MLSLAECQALPKVELHVHIEGSIRPETVLRLAKKNDIDLPATTVAGLREWYRFTDFPHFVEVYTLLSQCIQEPEDIEFIVTEFMAGQAEQNILYTEATYTAGTILQHAAIPIDEQIDALRRGITQGRRDHGVDLGIIMDFVRQDLPEDSVTIAEHAVDAHGKGVVALGLSGIEGVGPAEDHRAAFNYAMAHGLPIVPHAGETQGADSIWEALELTECKRIGHGIRCLEDDALVNELIEQQVVLEVCPSSNVCLNVVPSWEEHPLAKLRDRGLRVTLNSDDPPMFNTTLSEEYHRASKTWGWNADVLQSLVLNAAKATLQTDNERAALLARLV